MAEPIKIALPTVLKVQMLDRLISRSEDETSVATLDVKLKNELCDANLHRTEKLSANSTKDEKIMSEIFQNQKPPDFMLAISSNYSHQESATNRKMSSAVNHNVNQNGQIAVNENSNVERKTSEQYNNNVAKEYDVVSNRSTYFDINNKIIMDAIKNTNGNAKINHETNFQSLKI